MNPHTHEVRALTNLTDEERATWIAENEEAKARLEKLFPAQSLYDAAAEQERLFRAFAQRPVVPGAPGTERRGGFDALGRPRR